MKQKRLTDFMADWREEKASTSDSQTNSGTQNSECSSDPYLKKRRKIIGDENRQYTLDAGQKDIGTQYCDKCGMVYELDSVSDCNMHMEYHERFTKRDWFRVKYSQIDLWRKQNFSTPFDGGYVFMVNSSSKSTLRQRLEEIVLKCVNIEIGFAPDLSPVWDKFGRRQAWVFVAASAKQKFPFIAAAVLVEGVAEAFYSSKEDENGCSQVLQGWSMGVNRVWVHSSSRRCGIATKLLDLIRRYMRRDCVIPRERIAFSELTEGGESFTNRFCPNGRVLRYSLVSNKSPLPDSHDVS